MYDERLVRAMDFLLGADEELQRAVFFATADLFNLEVDLLLYDTTSSYFEMEDDDEERTERERRWDACNAGLGPEPTRPRPQVVNEPPLRLAGHSRDQRPDLPQVVVGLAVTRQGIPVRCWVWPGNTNDATTVAEVKASLAGWRLDRVVWAVDRGMVSEDNLRELRRGGAHSMAGERLRAGKKTVEAGAGPGRAVPGQVRDNLEVKEVVVGEGERRARYVLVRNPAQVGGTARSASGRWRGSSTRLRRCPAVAKSTPRRCASCSRTDAGPVPEAGSSWSTGDRPGQGQGRGAAGREVLDRDERRLAVARGRGPWVQAARRGGASVADDEDGARPAADAPPQGGPDQGARAAVLAGAAAGAGGRGALRADVAAGTAGDGPVAPRGLRGDGGAVRPAHRADPAPAQYLEGRRGAPRRRASR